VEKKAKTQPRISSEKLNLTLKELTPQKKRPRKEMKER
jgi:hypothetical protein